MQTYDEKPRRRLWELLKSQGMQENQQVVFMSDGGEDVRRVQEYLQPHSEHLIDWFHITMRVTVMQQQTKALEEERPETGADVSKRLNSAKHLLWHGNTEEALERLSDLIMELSLIQAHSGAAKKVGETVCEFHTYIRNNQEYIPNYGELYRQGGTITTSFVESTINQVVSKRFVKKQQMAWTLRGAHLLLQTRTRVLNNELEEVFRRWYPRFRAQASKAACPPTFWWTPSRWHRSLQWWAPPVWRPATSLPVARPRSIPSLPSVASKPWSFGPERRMKNGSGADLHW